MDPTYMSSMIYANCVSVSESSPIIDQFGQMQMDVGHILLP